MSFINTIASSIGTGWMDLLVYAVIVFVFIIGLIKCIFPVMHNRSILRKATVTIREDGRGEGSWQEESFLGRGSLHSHWSEYLNNLFFADGVYHNASNVEDYINEETVIYDPGRGAFSEAVPSLLVSIGFLGTLLGLAKGLSGFSMSDSSAVMDSIVTLIPGMRYAFMTSIFGVIGSVSFTLITRAVQGSTMHTLRSFYSAMSRYAGVRSVDPMTQVAIYQQEQTAMIRQMSEDLAGRLGDNIAGAVAQAVEPMNQTLKNFVSVTTKDQMRFLDAVVNRFVDRMDDVMGGQMQRLSHAVEETTQRVEQAYARMSSGLQESADMLESVREISRIADDTVRIGSDYFAKLESNRAKAEDAVAHMDELSLRQADTLRTMQKRQDDISNNLREMLDQLDRMTAVLAKSSDANSEAMLSAARELRDAGDDLRNIHRDATNAINAELKDTLDAYEDYVNSFTKRVDYLAGSISKSLEKLPESVNEASDRFLNEIDRLTDTVIRADEEINRVGAQLRAADRR